MKRLFSCILAMAILLTLCACGSETTSDSSQSKIELPNSGRTTPSNEAIQEDITNALLQKNPIVELTGVETIKSQTTDNRYKATIQVYAATTYADWQMECDMTYTMYDQGWILDEIDWNSKDYVIARIPDVETLSEIANHTEVSAYYQDILPVENATIDARNVEGLGLVELHWTKTKEYLHAQCVGNYITFWIYNAETDNWEFSPCDNGFGFYSNEIVTPFSVDFTGNWDGIEISNFSWDGFNVKCGDIDAYFYKVSGPPYSSEPSYGWYTDGSGKYFQIQCGPLGTSLSIRSFGHVMMQYAYVSIQNELPFL